MDAKQFNATTGQTVLEEAGKWSHKLEYSLLGLEAWDYTQTLLQPQLLKLRCLNVSRIGYLSVALSPKQCFMMAFGAWAKDRLKMTGCCWLSGDD